MEIFKKAAWVVLYMYLYLFSNSQKPDSAYLIYEKQFNQLLTFKGIDKSEINDILYKYRSNHIYSNQEFAKLIGKFYSAKKNIGVLLYFFNNDTLKRIFFEPGLIKEEKSIAIKKGEIFELSKNLDTALSLYKLSYKRSPRLRGVIVKDSSVSNKKYNLDTAIAKLTSLLIPNSFDEGYRHLIVIPCLNIGSIPFQLLKPYKDDSYLIDRCSFTIAPNLIDFIFLRIKILKEYFLDNPADWDYYFKKETILFDQASSRELPGKETDDSIIFTLDNPLFICNPAYPSNTKYIFPDLPGAEKEINSALPYAQKKYTLLKGAHATRASVLKFLGNCDLAYFATHGMADINDPMLNSFLVLSGDKPFLTSKEIQDLRLNRDYHSPKMVILSACQTGLGKPMEGGTAGSLARSFILSGCNFVIESLWNVDDDATAYLMSRFMYYMQQKTRYFPAGTLRLAILDTKKKYPNPSKWASFSVFGGDF